jgi:hypothetical protein
MIIEGLIFLPSKKNSEKSFGTHSKETTRSPRILPWNRRAQAG